MQHITGISWAEDQQNVLDIPLAEHRKLIREENIRLTKRAISESVTADKKIIAAIQTIEEFDRVSNMMAKKLREWYALYDPELERDISDHKGFAAAVLEARLPQKATMGGEFDEIDRGAMLSLAQTLSIVTVQREETLAYLDKMMAKHTPNIRAVAGSTIGANLIAHAGSLRRLCMFPAGTVQLLGAEAALFKHLRNKKSRPPKHGIIFNHELLQRAPRQKRGRIARVLADCISIASRFDFFKGEYVGDTLRAKVEKA